ncbi:hypothetical protein ACFYXC_34695 [Streptomyces sp. NPDC002701]|uniref:hypothetical protein n=1 Tax=Streptomyces sp. NPDC002701 TaxID=3364661 RepID=UPI00369387E5
MQRYLAYDGVGAPGPREDGDGGGQGRPGVQPFDGVAWRHRWGRAGGPGQGRAHGVGEQARTSARTARTAASAASSAGSPAAPPAAAFPAVRTAPTGSGEGWDKQLLWP